MWNLISANRIATEKHYQESYYKHINNLVNVKPRIDTKAPYAPDFLRSRAKQQKNLENRNAEITQENRILLDKMMAINERHTAYNPTIIHRKSFQGTNRKSQFNSKYKMEQLRKIDQDNQTILKRLQSAKSVYGKSSWQRQSMEYERLKANIAKGTRRDDYMEPTHGMRISTAIPGRRPIHLDEMDGDYMPPVGQHQRVRPGSAAPMHHYQ